MKGKSEKPDVYSEWIANNVGEEFFDNYGKCEKITKEMKEAFPELIRVRGHYHCPIWGRRAHWWFTTPDGKIVDPTKRQFPSGGIGKYVPWDESKPEPTGKCQNCGKYVYNYGYFCSDKCREKGY